MRFWTGASVSPINPSLSSHPTTLQFALDIPAGLFQILYRVAFQISAPDVFHGVAKVEAHVFGDLDAFHT
ncbi:hypothetical protein AmDm5_0507 [Acetobacter malorum]|nr:hypothetical protein AmDm5_0507 [Acetobacter malorum]